MRTLGQPNFPISLTFDIDWAPDFAIQKVVSTLEEHNIPGTLFLTHPSAFVERLAGHPLIEFGIHPNFFPGSSHGKSCDEVLDYVLKLCPNTTAMRTHGLFQNSNLYFYILKNYPQIRYDFSLYLPNNPYLRIFNFQDDENNFLTRVPYQWEDDLSFIPYGTCSEDRHILFSHASYQVFDFHPIHVYLNSNSSLQYNSLKEKTAGRALFTIDELEAQPHIYSGHGVGSELKELVTNTPKDRFVFATEIPQMLSDYQISNRVVI